MRHFLTILLLVAGAITGMSQGFIYVTNTSGSAWEGVLQDQDNGPALTHVQTQLAINGTGAEQWALIDINQMLGGHATLYFSGPDVLTSYDYFGVPDIGNAYQFNVSLTTGQNTFDDSWENYQIAVPEPSTPAVFIMGLTLLVLRQASQRRSTAPVRGCSSLLGPVSASGTSSR